MAEWELPFPRPPHLRRPERLKENPPRVEEAVDLVVDTQVPLDPLPYRAEETVTKLPAPRRVRRPPPAPPVRL